MEAAILRRIKAYPWHQNNTDFCKPKHPTFESPHDHLV
jgi:hypothetical protein